MWHLSFFKLLFSKHFLFFCLLGVVIITLENVFIQLNRAPTLQIHEFFQLTVIAAVVEELFFRGILQQLFFKKSQFLSKAFGPVSFANLLTSAIFAFAHLIYYQDDTALLTFFPSLIFGYLLDKDNSVMPAIVMHMFYNAFYFAPSLLLAKGMTSP